MSKKLLVANRSEIACRVMTAARECGLAAVGIYVKGDEDARHVTLADEVHEVPSYLDKQAIVDTAKRAGVFAIHPGYGFLSERAEFADLVEAAGIVFLGPRGETIRKLGDKIASKELCDELKVPTSPWAKLKTADQLKQFCESNPLPVLLKASAGGGGKGMRIVRSLDEATTAFESASREAEAAFGDGTMFVERLIEGARHVEIQFFGDGRGGAMHLYERECSLQRRHQKVVEESPAPNLAPELRRKMTDSAVALASQVKYRSAGTAEFLVTDSECFFLEVNSRLQVEHTVTELVTGADLVAMQIALGQNPKGFTLPELAGLPRGHAIEARICAEDPARGFMPGPGKVVMLKWPTGTGIRVESGIEEGQEIRGQFDSMLAKLIVWAPTREAALARLKEALDSTVILGLTTNIDYIRWLCDQPRVIEGRVTTQYLETLNFKPSSVSSDLARLPSEPSPWFEAKLC